MNDVEDWRNAYLRACEQCRTLWVIHVGLELHRTVGPGHIADGLRQLDAQGLFTDVVTKTVAKVFADEFSRAPDGSFLGRQH